MWNLLKFEGTANPLWYKQGTASFAEEYDMGFAWEVTLEVNIDSTHKKKQIYGVKSLGFFPENDGF